MSIILHKSRIRATRANSSMVMTRRPHIINTIGALSTMAPLTRLLSMSRPLAIIPITRACSNTSSTLTTLTTPIRF